MIPKFEYPALVRQEAKNLLKYATKAELNNLDFETFIPKQSGACIYGQMTGSCFTERAEKLIKKCASKVYDATSTMEKSDYLADRLVGSPKKRERYKSGIQFPDNTDTDFYSPIEVFVYLNVNQNSGANERLINYLKGKIKTL